MTELANILDQDKKNPGTFALYIMKTFEDVDITELSEDKLTSRVRYILLADLKKKIDGIMFELWNQDLRHN